MTPATTKKTRSPRKVQNSTQRIDSWKFAAAAVLVTAFLLRVLYLSEKPLHADEGVNGFFMTNLFRTGYYHYDPNNYHGPSLYYLALVTTTINSLFFGRFGLSTFAIRIVPAIFGVALLWLVWLLRPRLGKAGALVAAALLAVAPGLVFFSRYFIHEVLFVFFTLALVVAVLRYAETARTRYLMLAALSAALLFATKETCIITFAVLLLAWLCARLYLRLRNRPFAGSPVKALSGKEQLRRLALAFLLFAAVSVVLFSSFFSNFPQGVYDSLKTFKVWAHTSTSAYQQPWFTYFDWLLKEEFPILVLGGLGTLSALFQARNRFAVMTAFWSLGIFTAYSLIPYKTPWLALNLILPLALMAGYVFEQMWSWAVALRSQLFKAAAMVVLVAALSFSLYQAIDLSFFRYDDEKIPYIYAHTRRDFLFLVNELDSIAAHNNLGASMGIAVLSPEYWPLPWYLRHNTNAAYWGHVTQTSQPIVIALDTQAPEVQQTLGTLYRPLSTYDLRPGVRLTIYLRRDLHE